MTAEKLWDFPSLIVGNGHLQSVLLSEKPDCQVHAVLSIELTLNMITIILDRNASNYVPSREMPLQERSHKIPLHQKRNTKAQMSYWRGAYGKMRVC